LPSLDLVDSLSGTRKQLPTLYELFRSPPLQSDPFTIVKRKLGRLGGRLAGAAPLRLLRLTHLPSAVDAHRARGSHPEVTVPRFPVGRSFLTRLPIGARRENKNRECRNIKYRGLAKQGGFRRFDLSTLTWARLEISPNSLLSAVSLFVPISNQSPPNSRTQDPPGYLTGEPSSGDTQPNRS